MTDSASRGTDSCTFGLGEGEQKGVKRDASAMEDQAWCLLGMQLCASCVGVLSQADEGPAPEPDTVFLGASLALDFWWTLPF